MTLRLGLLFLPLLVLGFQERVSPPLRSIGFLVLPGVYNSELMAPYDVLHHLRGYVKDYPEVFTVAQHAGTIETYEGLILQPAYTFADAPEIDLLVVPSAKNNMDADLRNEAMLDWVRRAGGKAGLLLSLCDGAFILARAGLLDGLEATTFPADQERFGAMFPRVKLRREVLFVHDGKAITAAGGARSYEPALYLVEKLYGRQVAVSIARGLVLEWQLEKMNARLAPGALWPGKRR